MPIRLPVLKAPKTSPNPNSRGLHNQTRDNDNVLDRAERLKDENSEDPESKEKSKEIPKDEHKKDMPHVELNKVELIGSVSEAATKLLDEELPKLDNMPPDKRIVVITDKASVKNLIPLVKSKDRKFGVYHNRDTHLPMFDRATEEWLDSNNIPHSDDLGELLKMLGGT